jgi:hypothetical protein
MCGLGGYMHASAVFFCVRRPTRVCWYRVSVWDARHKIQRFLPSKNAIREHFFVHGPPNTWMEMLLYFPLLEVHFSRYTRIIDKKEIISLWLLSVMVLHTPLDINLSGPANQEHSVNNWYVVSKLLTQIDHDQLLTTSIVLKICAELSAWTSYLIGQL